MTPIELCEIRIEKRKRQISETTDEHKLFNLHETLRCLEAARDYLKRYPKNEEIK